MLDSRNSDSPNGGVIVPIIRLKITTMPRWIGSTPAATTGGAMIGTSSRVAVVESTNMPAMKKMTLTTSSIISGLVVMSLNQAENSCGTCSTARIQPNIAAAPTMMSTAAEVRTVSTAAR